MASLLVSAWGGIVPFVGPTFGYNANGASSWDWTSMHAWLYAVPGIIGVVASLLVMARARAGSVFARAELLILGLVLMACGAWFVLGPSAWPVIAPSGAHTTAFTTGSPLTVFTNMLGYNLGVGLVLAALGGMVTKAAIGERVVAEESFIERSDNRIPVTGAEPGAAAAADRTTNVRTGEPTSTYPTATPNAGSQMTESPTAGRAAGEPTTTNQPIADQRSAAAPPTVAGSGPSDPAVAGNTYGEPGAAGATADNPDVGGAEHTEP